MIHLPPNWIQSNTHTWTLTAIQLVAAVCALCLSGALEDAGDARAITALELIRATRNVLAVGLRLVLASWTILLAVAQPPLVDARHPVVALELGRPTRQERRRSCLRAVLWGAKRSTRKENV